MFCPNCGTQNPDTAQTCSKCNFNLKGAAAPKFKGTMLMQQSPQVPVPLAGAPAPPAAAPPAGAPMPMPSKLKGTMVGVAPPMAGSAPLPPSDQGFGAPPQPYQAPGGFGGAAPPPPAFGGAPPGYGGGAPQEPSTFGSNAGVNPLGGTMVAPDGMGGGGFGGHAPGGYGGPSPQGAPYGAPAPGQYGAPQQPYGADPNAGGYGAPAAPQAPGQYGAPPQGQYGAQPQGQYGAQPGQEFGQQMQQGFNQGVDAISQGINQALGGGGGYGAPQQQQHAQAQQQGYGAASQGGAMQPYPGGPMMQQQGMPGAHGPKAQPKNPLTAALMVAFIPFYGIIWLLGLCGEISAYLQRDEPKAGMVILLSMVTCGLYALYWMIMKLGPMVQEMQQRAGVQNPENRGIMYWIPIYGVMCLQEDLNRVWQSPH